MQALRQYINTALNGIFPELEIRSFFYQIMEHITGGSRSDILANKYSQLSDIQIAEFQSIVTRLQKSEPIQYILAKADFYDLEFKVAPGVLIPRPETEQLVEWIIDDNVSQSGLRILDIGTGSGCIPISLARNLHDADVSAFDISNEALVIAKENARLSNVNIHFKQVDILSPDKFEESGVYDIIVSNPPYICEKEKLDMQANVLEFEPFLALFVSNVEPLIFYKEIAQFALEKLVSGGRLYFEINQAFGLETVNMLKEFGFSEIELRKDFFEKDRMIKALKT